MFSIADVEKVAQLRFLSDLLSMASAAPCEYTCTSYDNFNKATVHCKIAFVRLESTCLA